MGYEFSDNLLKILSCPGCGRSLSRHNESWVCHNCETVFSYSKFGSLDLRLRRPKPVQYEFNLGAPLLPVSGFGFELLSNNVKPEVDYRNFDVPRHLSRELLSHFPKAKNPNSLMLDIGCGNAIHRKVCEHAGFEYVGLDYDNEKAPILGDAHALPFKDASFEFILAIAVLEHIRFPFVMIKEAYRVLEPNGKIIGTVAFLEPFHRHSYYHHTHLGTYNLLREGGFEIEQIAPSVTWSGLVAQAKNGLFPKMPPLVWKSIVMPIQWFHKLWWAVRKKVDPKATEDIRIIKNTAAFAFIARRKESGVPHWPKVPV
jgi:SAM-dependent methyltransferase